MSEQKLVHYVSVTRKNGKREKIECADLIAAQKTQRKLTAAGEQCEIIPWG